MGVSLGKNTKRSPMSKFSDFKGLVVKDFNILWEMLINHEEATLDLKKEVFIDIMNTFCEDYINRDIFESVEEEDAKHFKLATSVASRETTLNTFFDSFTEDDKSLGGDARADAIQLFVAMLLVNTTENP